VALTDTDAARLARLVPAAPAVASAALRATRLAGGGAETARLIVAGVARAVSGGGLPAPELEHDASYDPALVNADCDLAALTADLLRDGAPRAVSFLLAGPPGAGKSAWVRHLAGRMGLPVLHKRASDLLDPFVGGTEQNIAGAFAEARDTHAFLVFGRVEDGRSGLGHPASPCFPSPLIKPYVPISGIPAFRLASPRAYGGRMLRASSVFPPRLGVAIQLVRKAPGLTRCFTGLRQVTDPRLL
jgi:hypothetical protein